MWAAVGVDVQQRAKRIAECVDVGMGIEVRLGRGIGIGIVGGGEVTVVGARK